LEIPTISSVVELKWHRGQLNCTVHRDPQDDFFIFAAMGQALQAGQGTRMASAVGMLAVEISMVSRLMLQLDQIPPISRRHSRFAQPTRHRRAVTMAAACSGCRP
jgi:hypothetical protein